MMNYKRILMLALLAICIVGFTMSTVSAIDVKVNSVGTRHYFTLTYQINDNSPVTVKKNIPMSTKEYTIFSYNKGDEVKYTFNSKAWIDQSFFNYTFEPVGTTITGTIPQTVLSGEVTKKVVFSTFGDTVWKGGWFYLSEVLSH